MQNSPFDFSMMQIDCEVVGTSLIQFPEAVVPSHLKNQGSANSTAQVWLFLT